MEIREQYKSVFIILGLRDLGKIIKVHPKEAGRFLFERGELSPESMERLAFITELIRYLRLARSSEYVSIWFHRVNWRVGRFRSMVSILSGKWNPDDPMPQKILGIVKKKVEINNRKKQEARMKKYYKIANVIGFMKLSQYLGVAHSRLGWIFSGIFKPNQHEIEKLDFLLAVIENLAKRRLSANRIENWLNLPMKELNSQSPGAVLEQNWDPGDTLVQTILKLSNR